MVLPLAIHHIPCWSLITLTRINQTIPGFWFTLLPKSTVIHMLLGRSWKQGKYLESEDTTHDTALASRAKSCAAPQTLVAWQGICVVTYERRVPRADWLDMTVTWLDFVLTLLRTLDLEFLHLLLPEHELSFRVGGQLADTGTEPLSGSKLCFGRHVGVCSCPGGRAYWGQCLGDCPSWSLPVVRELVRWLKAVLSPSFQANFKQIGSGAKRAKEASGFPFSFFRVI